MVYCARCGASNAEGARYCNNCASALPLTAPSSTQSAPQPASSQPTVQPQPELPPQLQPGQKATLLDYLSHYQGLQYHWVKRFVALVLDTIFVVIPVYVILVFIVWGLGSWWSMFIGFVALFLYSGFLESTRGATIGKSVLGLKVVSTKGKLDLSDALVRNITKIVPILLLLEFVISLVVETTDAHQRYLDRLAKTTVIEKTA